MMHSEGWHAGRKTGLQEALYEVVQVLEVAADHGADTATMVHLESARAALELRLAKAGDDAVAQGCGSVYM